MLALRQQITVAHNGTLELSAPELREGMRVEVIVLMDEALEALWQEVQAWEQASDEDLAVFEKELSNEAR